MKTGKVSGRIRYFIEKRNMDLEALAALTELDISFLETMLQEDVYPPIGPLMKIARALGVRLGTFLDDQESRDPFIVRRADRQTEFSVLAGKNKPAALKFYSLGKGKTDRHYELVPELKTQQRGSIKSRKFPALKRVCFLGQEKHRGMYSIPEIRALSSLVSSQTYLDRPKSLAPHDVVNMQYTSGTTGFPKGVMLTHFNIGNNGFWIGENQRLSEKDTICLPVPLFHCSTALAAF